MNTQRVIIAAVVLMGLLALVVQSGYAEPLRRFLQSAWTAIMLMVETITP